MQDLAGASTWRHSTAQYNDNQQRQLPREHESRSKGVWLEDPMICTMGPIGNLDGPDVGSTPCSFNCIGGLMMHGTCCVEDGLLVRVILSYPRILCSALQPVVVEMLYNTTLQITNIVLYLAKKLQSLLASESFAPFPFRPQRLKHTPCLQPCPLPFRPRLSAPCSSQDFCHQ
jgi:hypothetical protein